MKEKLILTISLIFILALSFFVYAAGTSTITQGNSTNETQDNNTNETDTNDTKKDENNKSAATSDGRKVRSLQGINEIIARADDVINVLRECDALETREERIKCRLRVHVVASQKGFEEEESDYDRRTPEACRSLRNPVACIALYKRVQASKCYDIEDGRRKDHCLKRAANITKSDLKTLQKEERIQKSREYLVLLLYELQERIEKAHENGNVSDDDAAAIISLIVEIKQDILEGKRKTEILPKLQELRNKIREVRSRGETQ